MSVRAFPSFRAEVARRYGAPVIFEEVVHSIGTAEAGGDEQSVTLERPNGLSQECCMDDRKSRAVGSYGDPRWAKRAGRSRSVAGQCLISGPGVLPDTLLHNSALVERDFLIGTVRRGLL